MYSQRYFRREGLIYYGQDEYDDHHIDIHKVVWRKKKDYKDVELSAEQYLQRARAKLEKKEEELKKELRRYPEQSFPKEHFDTLFEIDLFMLYKSILEYGIKELEKNNFILNTNPFEELDREFKDDYTEDFINYFNKIGKPEFEKLIRG